MEHPVTEMISSVDLIEEQIRVARGEKLRYTQVTYQDVSHSYRKVQSFIGINFIFVYRMILFFMDMQLNAVLMQKMHSKISDPGQVSFNCMHV